MKPKKLNHIVCALRGRPDSRITVTYAINLALEHQAKLTFLYVLDADFMEYATTGALSVVFSELREMSEFIMLILIDRAQRRGVENVDFHICEGNIKEKIIESVMALHADALVLGKPGLSKGRPYFEEKDFTEFIDHIEKTTSVRVYVVQRQNAESE